MTVFRVVVGSKIVQIRAFQWVSLRREMLVFCGNHKSILEDSVNLPDPDVIDAEISEAQAAIEQFSQIASDLKS